MDNYEFNQLPLKAKAKFVWDHGTYLAHRKEKGFAVNLYAVKNFFAEIYYCPEEVCINKILSFTCKKRLTPYLENICLFNFL